jgi:hypothetical protein
LLSSCFVVFDSCSTLLGHVLPFIQLKIVNKV